MKPSVFFRIAAVLLLLFTLGHTLGFRQTPPEWKVDGVVAAMKQVRFGAQGVTRSYYDFYAGFGYTLSAYLLLAAVWCWILAGLPRDVLRKVVALPWALTACFVATTVMNVQYFFPVPIVLGALVTVLLAIGSWLAMRPALSASA
jgi:hypothetical protein